MSSNDKAADEGCDWGDALSAVHSSSKDGEDDQEGVDFVAGGEARQAAGLAPGELPNVVMLQDAAHAVKTGEITIEEFTEVYKKLEKKATNALKLYAIPAVKKDLPGKLTEEQNEIWSELERQLLKVKEGAELLDNYVAKRQLGDLETGVDVISKAIHASVENKKRADAEHAAIMERVKEEKAQRAAKAAGAT